MPQSEKADVDSSQPDRVLTSRERDNVLLRAEKGQPPQDATDYVLNDRKLPCVAKGTAILATFCLHNGWNCFTFLNNSSDQRSAQELFGVTEVQLGWCNTVGLATSMLFMPVAMLCRWRRTLLGVAGVLNLAGPVLRWIGAKIGNYELVILSYAILGAAWSIIGVWPPILAAALFPEKRRVLVIAIASLSNTVFGALSALLTPVFTDGTSEGLMSLFEVETYVTIVFLAMTSTWLWIPSLQEDVLPSLRNECLACSRPSVALHLVAFGVVVGLGVALQNMLPSVLQGFGFSTIFSDICNCVYQFSSLLTILVGACVTQKSLLRKTLYWLHGISIASCTGVLAVCWLVLNYGPNDLAKCSLLVLSGTLGASLMGLLPFVLAQGVYIAHPASENIVAGFILLVGIGVAAAMNQICDTIAPIHSIALVCTMLLLEAMVLVLLSRALPSRETFC